MKKDEIKKYLSTYKNVIEMINAANKLKRDGESEIMVNRCVAELRKEMLNATAAINRIPRRNIADTKIEPFGLIPVQIDNLSSPVIVWDGENVLM